MAFCITFGTQEFTSQLKGYEGVTAQCHNCGNWAAHCITRWPWFTVCFVPVIPLSTHKYEEVYCGVCRVGQDLQNRPDIRAQQGQQSHPQQNYPQGPPQGWGGGQQYPPPGAQYQGQYQGQPQGQNHGPPGQYQYH